MKPTFLIWLVLSLFACLRAFAQDEIAAVPNRPTVSTTAQPVQRGALETEWGVDAASTHQDLNGLLKFGLTTNFELRFANNPFTADSGTHGFGDEMLLHDFTKVMKEYFGILNEVVPRRIYAIRLIGSPYNAFVSECRSIQVMAHHRGKAQPAHISPHHIRAVLNKFNIQEKDFLDALTGKPSPLDHLAETEQEAEPSPKPN